jgi:membrane protease YdiL (CAAX protease family)
VPLLIVYLLVRVYWLVYDASGRWLDELWAQSAAQVLLWVLPCLAITIAWQRGSLAGAWRVLGLGHGLVRGMAFALTATLPMAIAAVAGMSRWPSAGVVAADGLLGPFAESVLFSGFLFTALGRRGWAPPGAIALCALAFGLAHVQDVDVLLAGSVASVVAGAGPDLVFEGVLPAVVATGAGGLLFTWLFHRWGTLWPAIALHGAINFWWAVSGEGFFQATFMRPIVTPAAVAQVISMGLAVAITLALTTRPVYSPRTSAG